MELLVALVYTVFGLALGVGLLAGLVAFTVVLIQSTTETRQRRLAAWARVAEARGWRRLPTDRDAWTGPGVDDHPLVLQVTQHGSDTYTEARVVGIAPRSARVRREPLLLLGATEEQAGDPEFDRAALLQIDELDIPRFGHRFRLAFRRGIAARLDPHLEGGDVIVRHRGIATQEDVLHELADHALALAAALGTGPRAELAAQQVIEDPEPGFRVRCLQVLAATPDRQRAAAREVLDCGEPMVEVAAGLILRDAEALRRNLDAELPRRLRERALRGLLELAGPDEVLGLLERVAREEDALTLKQVLRGLRPRPGTGQGLREALGILITRADQPGPEVWPLVAPQLCRALGAHEPGDPWVEEALLHLLVHGDSAAIRAAAAVGLKSAGSVAAVPTLSRIADGVGLLDPGGLGAACRQAITAIQGRAIGTPGSLAIADAPAGEGGLSVAERRRRGRLSEPER